MTGQRLRIVYMGSSDFAVPALAALYAAGHDIRFVVTQPDRVRGRNNKVLPTPVGRFAAEKGLTLLKPETLKNNEDFVKNIDNSRPDLIVVAAYGKILPKLLLNLPSLGCVNIHASLLPEYRGAAPVQRAILNGENVTGVTLMYMAEGLDTGDMIASAELETADMHAGELTEKLAALGAELLMETLPALVCGRTARVPQDSERATYAEKIEKAEGHLDLTQAAECSVRRIRAMTPVPGAYAMQGGERIVITEAMVLAGADAKGLPGEIMSVSKSGIDVCSGDGVLRILALKMPGKKAMPVSEYLKGNSFDADKHFE